MHPTQLLFDQRKNRPQIFHSYEINLTGGGTCPPLGGVSKSDVPLFSACLAYRCITSHDIPRVMVSCWVGLWLLSSKNVTLPGHSIPLTWVITLWEELVKRLLRYDWRGVPNGIWHKFSKHSLCLPLAGQTNISAPQLAVLVVCFAGFGWLECLHKQCCNVESTIIYLFQEISPK